MRMIGVSLPARWELPRLRLSVIVTIAAGTVLLAGAILTETIPPSERPSKEARPNLRPPWEILKLD